MIAGLAMARKRAWTVMLSGAAAIEVMSHKLIPSCGQAQCFAKSIVPCTEARGFGLHGE